LQEAEVRDLIGGDIVCIPVYGFEQKFRVKKCEVLE